MNGGVVWLSNCYESPGATASPDLKLPLLEVMYYLKKSADKPAPMNLGDLIQVVSESAKNQRETVATVVDLLESGRVRVQKRRAHVTF